MSPFELRAEYQLQGDQPQAVSRLVDGVRRGDRYQTLLGVTGSGKTFTMANVIAQVGKPALVMAPNKTLAAQLCNEFREFLPENAVEYFVSYYDYYQPEAYLPATDTYIEKDSSINQEIDRLRHAATSDLLMRDDVVIVASVSCIYGLGSPQEYLGQVVLLKQGDDISRDEVFAKLVKIHYERNDMGFVRGKFRVRGDSFEVWPAYDDHALRVSLWGDQVEEIVKVDVLTQEIVARLPAVAIYPATHFVTSEDAIERSLVEIADELELRVAELEAQGKQLEAFRLRQRTQYDMEMLRELGYCNGIENYSRILAGRRPGEPPYTLLDFFPKDFLVFIDESHMTVPQLHGMYEGDRSRKTMLVEHGFRLPSALDNRPLRFDEFIERAPQLVFVSATPGAWETSVSTQVVEQLVRPTGLVDPRVEVRPTKHQIDDLMNEIRARVDKGQRSLVTTLTKKMAEDLTDYLLEMGFRVRYLHSEVDTIERIRVVRELRLGEVDVLVGINLLREGLDLPEVTLVAILDADKEGFLRGETALVQTIGRAARNVEGTVIMYADKRTVAMERAISETDRRRAAQLVFNEEHGIEPRTIVKAVSDIAELLGISGSVPYKERRKTARGEEMSAEELERLMATLEEEMFEAAEDLRFEYAAKLRDEVKDLARELARLRGDASGGRPAPR
ncbi:MAG: excinuclease ABC subunit B [Actinobacteria bacterium RBG_16_64_13]|nr:MAG: excinuclease ABC subunit B [Actinobacteria bacterium RBG_16_64_13]